MGKTWFEKLEESRSHRSGQMILGEQPISDKAVRSLKAVLSMFSTDLLGFAKQIFDRIEFQVVPAKNLCTLSFSKMMSSGNKAVSHQALDKVWPGAGPFGEVGGSIFLVNDSVTGVVLAEGHVFILELKKSENIAASDGENFSWKCHQV